VLQGVDRRLARIPLKGELGHMYISNTLYLPHGKAPLLHFR
jgi:hypothetical protein